MFCGVAEHWIKQNINIFLKILKILHKTKIYDLLYIFIIMFYEYLLNPRENADMSNEKGF